MISGIKCCSFEEEGSIDWKTSEKASQGRWSLSWMLKGLEGDCQEEEEKKADQVKGSAGAKAQTCETGAALRSMAGSSVSRSKGFGWPMEGIWGNNAGLQMA